MVSENSRIVWQLPLGGSRRRGEKAVAVLRSKWSASALAGVISHRQYALLYAVLPPHSFFVCTYLQLSYKIVTVS